jgi:hypothetical protein
MVPRRDPQVVFRRLAGEDGGVLLHLDSGSYHGVNNTGSVIWELIDGERSRDDILGEMRARFPDAPELEKELAEFLDGLLERGLIAE